jgi:hypothetical protein
MEQVAMPVAAVGRIHGHEQLSKSRQRGVVKQSGTVQQTVSFYFTNVPKDISYKSLHQGFEV